MAIFVSVVCILYIYTAEAGIADVQHTARLFCGSTTNQCVPEGVLPGPQGEPDDGSLIPQPTINPQPDCCSSCSCNTSTCSVYDTCCVSVLDSLPNIIESMDTLRMSCVLPQFRPVQKGVRNAPDHVRMFTVCNPGVQSPDDIKEKCENADIYRDLLTKVPVSDTVTWFAYKNKYCASCHGVPEHQQLFWRVDIQCDDAFQANNILTLLEDVEDSITCNLIYILPHNTVTSSLTCPVLISTCNETGLWQMFDEEIEAACHAYTTPYRTDYKNVFCFMCNVDDIAKANEQCADSPKPFDFPTFSAYLVLPSTDRTEEPSTSSCEPDEIYEPVTVRSFQHSLMSVTRPFLAQHQYFIHNIHTNAL